MLKYEKGDIVNGIVTGIESYGFFVDLEDGNKGLVHISEISDRFVKDINEIVKVGDNIKVEIIAALEDKQYKLSIKHTFLFHKKYTEIKETPLGFSTLKKLLPIWIEKKMEEITEKM